MAIPIHRPAKPKKFTVLLGLGVFVVAVGFAVPRFLGSPSTTPKASESVQSFTLPTPSSDGPSLGMSLLKMALGVAVVSGGCIGIARWMKKRTATPAVGSMEVVARLALDRRCVLHLVQSGDRRLLLGIDAAGVKSLLEIPGEVPSTILSARVPVPSRFASVLATVS